MVTWILALLIAGPTMAQSNTCMQAGVAGQVAEGRLALGRFRDAADRPETAYILLLATPTCLSASDPDEAVQSTSELHIYSSQNSVHRSLQKLVGKTVLVRGEPWAAHTAHHHAPIVMDISEVDTQ
jgi:hypothetical protein